MKVHHTTIIKELGNCLICGNPILKLWKDKEEKNGQSEVYTEKEKGFVHYACTGGKSLKQLNDERK